MVNAAAQDQWRLLDVQDLDTRLAQIAHRLRTLPEHLEVERLQARLADTVNRLALARAEAGDIGRELIKAEADVEQVRQRAARDRARLDSGQGSAKDLTALQHELRTLAERQGVLEDVELAVMERQEAAQARVDGIGVEQEGLQTEIEQVSARRDLQAASLQEESAKLSTDREQAAAGIPADLIELYERVRAASGGVGAARLYQRRCEGCRLELNATERGRIRAAPDDAVIRCEECGRILVRTPDSGL